MVPNVKSLLIAAMGIRNYFHKLLYILPLTLVTHMNAQLDLIQKTADGLLFMSESDYPFEAVQFTLNSSTLEQQLQVIAQKEFPVEQQSLEYFFRNAIKEYPEANEPQKQTARRFQALQELLKSELKDVQVYRIGEI
jgi:hypothetical protein